MAPISIENTPPSNQSIPLKSIFGRVLKDITNTPQSVGFGSQAVQNRTIPSPMYGTHSPYVASTSMASCNSKSILFFFCQLLFLYGRYTLLIH